MFQNLNYDRHIFYNFLCSCNMKCKIQFSRHFSHMFSVIMYLEHLKKSFLFALTLMIQIVFEILKPLYIFLDELYLIVIFFFKHSQIKPIQIG